MRCVWCVELCHSLRPSSPLGQIRLQIALRAVAVAIVLLNAPFIPLLNGRLPASARSTTPKTSWSFFRAPLLWVYSVSNFW
ncbi:hypothetical protein F5Y18DRAFT_188499 [Xylariaceae sp. FL1019]|nr:hypothetical protein F5Y18DRAFT_188499 [Xylariaceae sp. FL1019]